MELSNIQYLIQILSLIILKDMSVITSLMITAKMRVRA